MASHLEVLTQFQSLMPGVADDIIDPTLSRQAEDVTGLIGRIVTGIEQLVSYFNTYECLYERSRLLE